MNPLWLLLFFRPVRFVLGWGVLLLIVYFVFAAVTGR